MNLVRFIDFLRDRLNLVIKVCYGLLGLLIAASALLGYLQNHHAEATEHAEEHAENAHGFLHSLYQAMEHHWWLWSIFGLIACVLIVYISKWYGHLKIGRTEIMAKEDFYNE